MSFDPFGLAPQQQGDSNQQQLGSSNSPSWHRMAGHYLSEMADTQRQLRALQDRYILAKKQLEAILIGQGLNIL